MLYAITALFAFQLLGEAIVQLTGLPLPGALVGTLLLLAALLLHGRLPESLEKAAGVLLQGLSRLYAGEQRQPGWLLGYASLTAYEIEAAVLRLANALRKP